MERRDNVQVPSCLRSSCAPPIRHRRASRVHITGLYGPWGRVGHARLPRCSFSCDSTTNPITFSRCPPYQKTLSRTPTTRVDAWSSCSREVERALSAHPPVLGRRIGTLEGGCPMPGTAVSCRALCVVPMTRCIGGPGGRSVGGQASEVGVLGADSWCPRCRGESS